jgi:glycosyltransferase involved in cell wall biosynthesis
MRIAQVAPLHESVPPRFYGGTERIISYLTEELVGMGHDVTLFASGDSVTSAKLVSPCRNSLRLDPNCVDPVAHHFLLVEQVAQRADNFDIIHWHIDYFSYPLSRRMRVPSVTTLHGRLDLKDLVNLYDEFDDIPLISISDNQKAPVPNANWQATVYHGLPPDLYTFREKKGKYLAFVGRMSREKRVDRAIEIALRTGIELKIAAKIQNNDRPYFKEFVEPLLKGPYVEYVGEIGEEEKDAFIGEALALLFPIDWPEPFGLVMIESFACGTPVIAFNCGSVSEVVKDGVTGYICSTLNEAVSAVERVGEIDRRVVRREFEERFSSRRMAEDYMGIYRKLAQNAAPGLCQTYRAA